MIALYFLLGIFISYFLLILLLIADEGMIYLAEKFSKKNPPYCHINPRFHQQFFMHPDGYGRIGDVKINMANREGLV